MSKKTVISELIEYFEQQLRLHRSSEIKYTTEEAWCDAIGICNNSIKIEKQQIKDANIAGMEFIPCDTNRYEEDSENYYSQTYQNETKSKN